MKWVGQNGSSNYSNSDKIKNLIIANLNGLRLIRKINLDL